MIELGWSKIHEEVLGWLNGLSIQGSELFGKGMKTNIKGKKITLKQNKKPRSIMFLCIHVRDYSVCIYIILYTICIWMCVCVFIYSL